MVSGELAPAMTGNGESDWVWVWEKAGYQDLSACPPWHPHARVAEKINVTRYEYLS